MCVDRTIIATLTFEELQTEFFIDHNWSFMVSLQHVIDMGDQYDIYDFCAGAIISPNFVLTAGVHI